jgi:hypothetical protein
MQNENETQAPASTEKGRPTGAPKRRVLLVDTAFQRKLLAQMAALICFLFLGFYALNTLFAAQALDAIANLPTGATPEEMALARENALAAYQVQMNLVVLVLSCCGLGVVYTLGLRITHKIAGPIYASIKHLDEVARGKSERELKFRDGDFFPLLAEAINTAVQALKKR